MQLPGFLQGMGQQVGGILQDPTQLNSNPLFQMGIGLLDPTTTTTQAVLGGLAGAQANQQEQEDRARLEKLRQELATLLARQGMGPPPVGMASPQMMGPPAPMPPAAAFGPPRPPGM